MYNVQQVNSKEYVMEKRILALVVKKPVAMCHVRRSGQEDAEKPYKKMGSCILSCGRYDLCEVDNPFYLNGAPWYSIADTTYAMAMVEAFEATDLIGLNGLSLQDAPKSICFVEDYTEPAPPLRWPLLN